MAQVGWGLSGPQGWQELVYGVSCFRAPGIPHKAPCPFEGPQVAPSRILRIPCKGLRPQPEGRACPNLGTRVGVIRASLDGQVGSSLCSLQHEGRLNSYRVMAQGGCDSSHCVPLEPSLAPQADRVRWGESDFCPQPGSLGLSVPRDKGLLVMMGFCSFSDFSKEG